MSVKARLSGIRPIKVLGEEVPWLFNHVEPSSSDGNCAFLNVKRLFIDYISNQYFFCIKYIKKYRDKENETEKNDKYRDQEISNCKPLYKPLCPLCGMKHK